jgi:CubicO group peptidase (beta-lactamase class C family)
VTAHFQQYIDDKKLAGLTTIVSKNGEVIHFQVYGVRDLETKDPIRRDTIYRIYSMTKPITSVAAMILRERGQLKLDNAVSSYLPEFRDLRVYESESNDGDIQTRPMAREMRVRDLLRHTSGLTYQFFSDSPVARMYAEQKVLDRSTSTEIMVSRLAKIPLLIDPGQQWHYSMSTDVLGRLIEVVDGRTLDVFFNEEIFEPLEMRDTAFHVTPEKHAMLAQMVTVNPEGQVTAFAAPMATEHLQPAGLLSGGGGLVSTAPDYLQFARMLLNKGELNGRRILKADSISLMTRNQLQGDHSALPWDKTLGFGLGFAVRLSDPADNRSGPAKGSFFWDGTANTLFWVDPEEKLVAILMTNILPLNVWPLRAELEALIYHTP